jgi:PAS domain S-box-containing protein
MKIPCLHVLIAEDEVAHAAAIRRVFEASGTQTEVQVVGTLREFRRRSAERPPDIAVVDLKLPDGRATEILTHPPEAGPFPVLVMTSYGNEQVAVEAIKAGALDYMVKSVEAFATMPHTVERALREWKLIQERQRAEAALREKSEELDRYFTSALDLFCIADTDGYFRRLNPQWEATLGYSLAELAGQRFLDFVHPEDLEATQQVVLRLSSQEPVFNFINRYRHKDGAYRWIEWRSFPQDKLIYAAARDITERREAEVAQQRLVAQLKEALANIKTLSGLLPICAGCKKIRDDKGYWNQVDSYIQEHSEAKFTHGLCPDCIKKYYPEPAETGGME